MAVNQNIKYVKLDDGVSFSLVRTNPKLTTNTKLMYNGKKIYMESYASSPLMNRTKYKNVYVKQNSTYNIDIARFLEDSGSQAYSVYQNFSDVTISDSYDNQFETFYWCGAEYIDSSFYSEEIGFVAPLYLREKLPNYFLIFRLNTPSNYNLNLDSDSDSDKLDSTYDFKTDILDKAVLIKTFDLREGSVLGNYIHKYIEQDGFEFDKSMYVNFSNAEVTYYGINKFDGVLEKKVESFDNELLNSDKPILKDDKWFTEGFERNNLIFPYIMNIEYLFDDDNFINENNGESYDFARYIGLYCNNIEFGEFENFVDLKSKIGVTDDDVVYYFEDINKNLHRYTIKEGDLKINGQDSKKFEEELISGFEKERITGYAEPLDIDEGFINRAQYGFKINENIIEGGDINVSIIIEYDGEYEYYCVKSKSDLDSDSDSDLELDLNTDSDSDFTIKTKTFIIDKPVNEIDVNYIAECFVKCINNDNIKSKFEAKCSENCVVIYAEKEELVYNNAKIYILKDLIDDGKITIFSEKLDENTNSQYYIYNFCGACNIEIDPNTYTYKNIFKIYNDEYEFFNKDRYLKTKSGDGRKITTNMMYVDAEGKINENYRIVIVDDNKDNGDVSVSSTYQVEILDIFKPNHGVLSWFPVKDFDFDLNFSTYGQYSAFVDECDEMSKKVKYEKIYNVNDTGDSDIYSTQENTISGINELAKSPFFDDYNNSLETEYEYYLENFQPDLCTLSKTTPYILKWGYQDEQKDSCENPYRLNVSKIFGVSNLSANTYLNDCDENEYTHSMPYYMTFYTPDYKKDYQYIESDDGYKEINDKKNNTGNLISPTKEYDVFVNYWINMFLKTDKDMFSYFFSGKKYGKRFDKKYSRLSGGDKFHNPSTLFRGVKFEAVRQFNGVEKRSSEYNDYKFSFIYIPIFYENIVFKETIYFVKNDTFKFIVGIIFVNTIVGYNNHNIFGYNVDYFNKAFLYAACKDIIRMENPSEDNFNLNYNYIFNNKDSNNEIGEFVNDIFYDTIIVKDINKFWITNFDPDDLDANNLNMWVAFYYPSPQYIYNNGGNDNFNEKLNTKSIIVSRTNDNGDYEFLGEFILDIIEQDKIETNFKNIQLLSDNHYKHSNITYYRMECIEDDKTNTCTYEKKVHEKKQVVTWTEEIKGDESQDIVCNVKKYKRVEQCGYVKFTLKLADVNMKLKVEDILDISKYYKKEKEEDEKGKFYFEKFYFNSDSLNNILINMKNKDCVINILFSEKSGGSDSESDGSDFDVSENKILFVNKQYYKEGENFDYECNDTYAEDSLINVDIYSGNIKIDISKIKKNDKYENESHKNGYIDVDNIDNLYMTIDISDTSNINESLAYKNCFSIFNLISAYNITNSINNDYNVQYKSTVPNNKYKIRVIEPDSIEVEDRYETVPVEITQNNKSVVGSVDIKEKINVDKIGVKVINRYSGYYNPIFKDLLYYDDYTFIKSENENEDENNKLAYSNTNIDYNYSDEYGDFGIIKNMYYHKTNTSTSDKILSFEKPVYPAINEYALDYRDYNIFSSNWDMGYFTSQDDLDTKSICEGIGSMKEGLCMFGSKYLNLPDNIFIDTFDNVELYDEKMAIDIKDISNTEIMYKEINDRTVRFNVFIEKRLKRYFKECLGDVFLKYINENYSFGDIDTLDDDIEEYVEKNLLKLYKVDKVYLYIKSEKQNINNKKIENDYSNYMNSTNVDKIRNGFPTTSGNEIKNSNFTMSKINEFDRIITYNLNAGFKESFGIGVSIKRK